MVRDPEDLSDDLIGGFGRVCRTCVRQLLADPRDERHGGQRQRAKLRSIDLRVSIRDPEVAIEERTSENRCEARGLFSAQVPSHSINVIEVVFQADRRFREHLAEERRRDQPPRLFLC
jgi:hypothetical protein